AVGDGGDGIVDPGGDRVDHVAGAVDRGPDSGNEAVHRALREPAALVGHELEPAAHGVGGPFERTAAVLQRPGPGAAEALDHHRGHVAHAQRALAAQAGGPFAGLVAHAGGPLAAEAADRIADRIEEAFAEVADDARRALHVVAAGEVG